MEGYSVVKRLGKGAFGEVHLVRRNDDSETLALKRIDFGSLCVAERKAMLLEVSLLGRLHHPYIIGYHEHFHDANDLCIVMELASGGDLDGELRRHRKAQEHIPEARLLDVLAQVGSALHYAHSCRVIHRDMKPANVLLHADGTTRLADFGISCTLAAHANQLGRELRRVAERDGAHEHESESAEVVTTLQGTPFYMAPELFSPDLHVDGAMFSAASDVWATGVMMYELMTLGERPYTGDSVGQIAYQLISDLNVNALSHKLEALGEAGYSPPLCAAVRSMLLKRPRQRTTLGALFDTPLFRTRVHGADAAAGIAEADAPPALDVLEAKAKALGGLLPDCYLHGRGAAVPRYLDDLMGIAVVHIACGAAHCAVVADTGMLYTWGDGSSGQLGHGDKRSFKRRRPVLFAAAARVQCAGVACGRAHTIAVDRDGVLYGFGSDKHGQLGLGPRGGSADGEDHFRDAMGCVVSPAALGAPPSPADGAEAGLAWSVVACGEAHSLALCTKGGAYAWGNAEDGRLGLPLGGRGSIDDAVVSAPRRLTLGGAPAVMVDVGNDFSAILDGDGRLWGCGANWKGQLGLDPNMDEYLEPTRMLAQLEDDLTVESVACGADHIAAIDALGRLWVWGGVFGESPTVVPLRDPESATDGGEGDECVLVACGASVTVAVSESGVAYSWGSGGGGRLGLGDGGKSHDTPQPLRALSTPSVRVQAVACGKGVSDEEDLAPGVLSLVTPEAPEALSEQFGRFLRAQPEQ